MAPKMAHPHFLLVTFPAQGHINPSLQFATRLLRLGARVTLATSVFACRRMSQHPTLEGLTLATFSDGYDDGFNSAQDDVTDYMSKMKHRGTETLTELIVSSETEGRPFTCLVYTLLLPWAAEVARGFHLPSALLWIQPAIVLDIYYFYFNGYGDMIANNAHEPSCVINLPGLPPLTSRDLPSFLIPSNAYSFVLSTFQEQIKALNEESKPKILVNSFHELEPEALTAIEKFNMIPIGPLTKDPSDANIGGDLFTSSNSYIEWLNSKEKASVIYVSFGSISVLGKRQSEEIAHGLINSGYPFLWVIRAKEKEEDKLSCREELEQKGIIVEWCSQVEVLSHPAIGCFVSHCGWNSCLESLVSGVPVVAFPQWTDQGTNAKLIEDVWKNGVRVNPNEEGIVQGDEIKRCLDLVMENGEKREELRRNANKWKDLAREAASEGGSSNKNLKSFVEEIRGCSK